MHARLALAALCFAGLAMVGCGGPRLDRRDAITIKVRDEYVERHARFVWKSGLTDQPIWIDLASADRPQDDDPIRDPEDLLDEAVLEPLGNALGEALCEAALNLLVNAVSMGIANAANSTALTVVVCDESGSCYVLPGFGFNRQPIDDRLARIVADGSCNVDLISRGRYALNQRFAVTIRDPRCIELDFAEDGRFRCDGTVVEPLPVGQTTQPPPP
jgi:hypothetical protein